ncbi:PREDICTED: probable G-protein coupled receptor 151 [Miniopterus natalensis]|uniref:probable G-protein coupled receptor 151 n=1 Tax=Miniopterus natalensis TaxID=291302 RepID=UPI0007A6E1FA|nr:PREDICTED: probable G-protein coupled receptor 151 [Miniopterus natalensis]
MEKAMPAAAFPGSNSSTMNVSLAHLHFAGGYLPSDSKDWRALVPALLVAVCLAGFVGNLCVIGTLLHSAWKGKPSLIHSLILNLSLADLSLLLFSAPVRAAAYSRAVWDLGWFLCKSSDWFVHTCMAAKSLTIVAVAKVCFVYASDPAKQVSVHSCTIWSVLAAIWAAAGLLPLPECFFSTSRVLAGVEMCLVDVPAETEVFASVFGKLYPLLVFCLPLLSASFYFWRAYGQCQKRGTKTRHLRNQMRSKQLTVMLLSTAIASAVLWLPEWVAWLWMWHLKAGGPAPPQGFIALSQVLMFSTSSANPLIFLMMSGEFKACLKGLWKWVRAKKHPAASASQEPPAGHSEVLPDNVPSPESPTSIPEQEKTGSPSSRKEKTEKAEAPTLPDVEQFWHERDTNPCVQDNDPIPWEHEDRETGE